MMNQQNQNSIEDIADFIRRWNINYPVDRWFREKHKIPFNSKKHRSSSILNMRMEFEEDLLYREESAKLANKKTKSYTPSRGDWLEVRKAPEMSQNEIDKAFDDIDIDSIEELENGDIII